MTVQTEEKLTVSGMASSAVHSPAEETLDNNEGWRIAREALVREVVRLGGQGALVLAILGTISYAGYWSLTEMKSLPAVLQKIAQPFAPPPPIMAPIDRGAARASTGRVAEEKAAVKVSVKKHHHRPSAKQIAARIGRRYAYPATAGDPTGGRIIYQDGLITQYSWNK